jgi:hypothetical protein
MNIDIDLWQPITDATRVAGRTEWFRATSRSSNLPRVITATFNTLAGYSQFTCDCSVVDPSGPPGMADQEWARRCTLSSMRQLNHPRPPQLLYR